MAAQTFIVDCPYCHAKVAANQTGEALWSVWFEEAGHPMGDRVQVGKCPSCKRILVAYSEQIGFEGWEGEENRWTSNLVRVYPEPPKTFHSERIPKVVTDSLLEADRCMQAGASTAACAMLGRALEGLCRDVLDDLTPPGMAPPKKIMLADGIKRLREKNIIDARLFDWSQQLHGFRNLAAHPEDMDISTEDARDLQTFSYAIVEYIYDLTDRYDDFMERARKRAEKKKKA